MGNGMNKASSTGALRGKLSGLQGPHATRQVQHHAHPRHTRHGQEDTLGQTLPLRHGGGHARPKPHPVFLPVQRFHPRRQAEGRQRPHTLLGGDVEERDRRRRVHNVRDESELEGGAESRQGGQGGREPEPRFPEAARGVRDHEATGGAPQAEGALPEPSARLQGPRAVRPDARQLRGAAPIEDDLRGEVLARRAVPDGRVQVGARAEEDEVEAPESLPIGDEEEPEHDERREHDEQAAFRTGRPQELHRLRPAVQVGLEGGRVRRGPAAPVRLVDRPDDATRHAARLPQEAARRPRRQRAARPQGGRPRRLIAGGGRRGGSKSVRTILQAIHSSIIILVIMLWGAGREGLDSFGVERGGTLPPPPPSFRSVN